jgi:hypothetical protein
VKISKIRHSQWRQNTFLENTKNLPVAMPNSANYTGGRLQGGNGFGWHGTACNGIAAQCHAIPCHPNPLPPSWHAASLICLPSQWHCCPMPFQCNAAQMALGGMIMGLLILPVSSVNLPEEENPNLTAN